MGIVKKLSDTRCSAYSDDAKAFMREYSQIKVVKLLATDNNQTSECQLQARAIINNMRLLETGIMERFASKIPFYKLHHSASKMDPNKAIELLKSLITFFNEQRGLFDRYEEQSIGLSGNENYRDFNQKRKKRTKT